MMDYQKLIDKALERGFEAVSITENQASDLAIVCDNGKITENQTTLRHIASVKGIYQGRTVNYYIENLDVSIDAVLDKMIQNAELASPVPGEIFKGSESYPEVEEKVSDFDQYPLHEKIALIKDVTDEMLALDQRAVFRQAYYSEHEDTTRIINSYGLDLSCTAVVAGISVYVVLGDGKKTQVGGEYKFCNHVKDLFDNTVAKDAVTEAQEMFDAKPIPTGEYDIVIENRTFASLLRAFLSAFTGSAVYQNLTPFVGKEGQKLFSDKLTLTDDPFLKEALVQYKFDMEGVAVYKKDLVKNGVLETFMYDLKSAKALGKKPTGNALDGTRHTNLVVQPGTLTNEQLIAPIKKGFYVTQLDGIHAAANAITGEFSLKASGKLIENGKKTQPVTLVVLSGNFYEMLNNIVDLGNDVRIHNHISSPSIRFKPMNVSGE